MTNQKNPNPSDTNELSIERDIDFLYEMGTLRFSIRTWNQFLNPNAQNLTEHTLRVIWISLALAKHEGAKDTEKLMKMALIHDISESRSVDVNYLSRQYADRYEHKALADTLKDTALSEFLDLWEEYEKKDCLEAKIVKDADYLDVELELKELEAMGNRLGQVLMPSRKKIVEEKLYTETARKMWYKIQESDPHHWHMMVRTI
jgi:5'-deoxynucleotidase YfbR-like HD superfamily hydrolase